MHGNRLLYFTISVCILILDQFTKYLATIYLQGEGILRVMDSDLIWLVFVQNPGTAFGMRFLPPTVLLIISVVASIGLASYLFRNSLLTIQIGVPLSMILGGAIGNMTDRVLNGRVVDFLSVDFPDFIMSRWPTFNVADSAISVGVVILFILSFSINSETSQDDSNEISTVGDV